MIILCISVYGKDGHFVACITEAEEWTAFLEAQQLSLARRSNL